MATLATPLTEVLGAKTSELLESQLNLVTVEDLLRHYPRRYDRRGALTDLGSVSVGDHVTIQGEVRSFTSLRNSSRPGTRQEVVVSDGTGTLTLMFFNQPWREKDLRQGRRGMFSGQIGMYRNKRQLSHPEYEMLENDEGVPDSAYLDEFIAVYGATAKVQSWTVAKCVATVLDKLGDIAESIDTAMRTERGLPTLRDALVWIHKPTSDEQLELARERLKWDEALALQTVLAQQRYEEEQWPAIPRAPKPDGLLAKFDSLLPYTLTAGQREVSDAIEHELAEGHAMHRLLQGEVGSGKTVVALRAMLTVVDSGGQAALLAPTEVLAQQHYRSITSLLGPLAERGKLGAHDEGTGVTLLTGSLNTATRRQALLDITSGQAGIVVGTHALLEDRVDFFDLGLVVIDEQHRFGVEQRASLVAKAGSDRRPHVLVMTATPIPRTVAMTAFGALDISTLTELPAGRSPIATHVVYSADKPALLDRAWERACEEVAKGHQVYVVVPRIIGKQSEGEESQSSASGSKATKAPKTPKATKPKKSDSDQREPVALEDLLPMLETGPLATVRVGAMHGGIPAPERDEVMRRFALGPGHPDGIDVLVATTVIEVGVDVPNATMMIIMDADRFGISQLHQLRGRVGRGSAPGLCLLVSEAPSFTPARDRLDAVASTTDGFELAALDLEQRREGDVLGKEQSGMKSSLKLVSVLKDEALLDEARTVATSIIASDPRLERHPELAATVEALVAARAEFVQKS